MAAADPAAAAREGITPDELAATTAELWRNGLAKWDQDPERIARLNAAADTVVYTPGSSAGLPVSVLRNFAPPAEGIMEEKDLLRERIMNPIGASPTWRWHGYENSWVELDGRRLQSVSGGGIADRLAELGYSHIVVHSGLFRQWLASTDEQTASRVNAFVSEYLQQRLVEGGFGLYEIVPPAPPEPMPASAIL